MYKSITIGSDLAQELDLVVNKCPYGDPGCLDETCDRCQDSDDSDPDYMTQETFLYLPKHYK